MTPLKLTLGPLLYLWPTERWRDFYFEIADESPVDVVVLGETVCSKRLHFMENELAAVIERLEAAGKQVRLSTLALVTLDRESKYQEGLADATHLVETNDLSALHMLKGRPHSVGPFVNVYNGATARILARNGATSICLPPELPAASVVEITRSCPDIAFELFAFGRVPLAISARCAHARSKGRTKDNCQFVCQEDPDGLPVNTLSGQPFLALNGVQTVSHCCQALLEDPVETRSLGVTSLRLSPQACDMTAVSLLFRALADGAIKPVEAKARLQDVYPAAPLSNGFHHGVAGAEWVARLRNSEGANR
ncbi:U32 family peptidase [Rhizobium anhuiense]|uniref:Ubiquinone biosynthesis protein UbiV n=1 Tax=Rhizobium anhuiense TaxID=1184720 RepID=A0ABX4IZ68_9HYPH|nr:U32 family peptidase [Rhizobium anhuiense]PDS40579.1 U32 family peptidase [Rhizobium anhuiense]PDS47521.1 U32 family peptidase [Rhizobium anhuiense]